MKAKTGVYIVIGASSALVAVIAAVMIYSPATNAGFKDAASTLAFVSGAAVAIERVIEAFWTFLGSSLGAYWPLTSVNRQVNSLVTELDLSMKPFHVDLKNKLEELCSKGRMTQEEMEKGKEEIDRIKRRFDELKTLAPDTQRVQLMAAAASQHVNYFFAKYKGIVRDIDRAGAVANTAISGLQDFLATFKDNPGRRLISIYLGAILGVAVAGVMGLDVFHALLDQEKGHIPHPMLQIILTGVMIGLGSGPTHEVIRFVQEVKQGRKGSNISTPNLPDPPDAPPSSR